MWKTYYPSRRFKVNVFRDKLTSSFHTRYALAGMTFEIYHMKPRTVTSDPNTRQNDLSFFAFSWIKDGRLRRWPRQCRVLQRNHRKYIRNASEEDEEATLTISSWMPINQFTSSLYSYPHSCFRTPSRRRPTPSSHSAEKWVKFGEEVSLLFSRLRCTRQKKNEKGGEIFSAVGENSPGTRVHFYHLLLSS